MTDPSAHLVAESRYQVYTSPAHPGTLRLNPRYARERLEHDLAPYPGVLLWSYEETSATPYFGTLYARRHPADLVDAFLAAVEAQRQRAEETGERPLPHWYRTCTEAVASSYPGLTLDESDDTFLPPRREYHLPPLPPLTSLQQMPPGRSLLLRDYSLRIMRPSLPIYYANGDPHFVEVTPGDLLVVEVGRQTLTTAVPRPPRRRGVGGRRHRAKLRRA